MKLKLIALLILGMTTSYAQTVKKKATSTKAKTSAVSKASAGEGIFATFETTKGSITCELAYKSTPVTVANFIALAEGTNVAVAEQYKGKPFYNGLKFHRVIADFMIQGGDPAGNGSGGPGYDFKDEITDAKFDRGGILAMANRGPATNGSQFFITHKETPWLNTKHTIFGYVTKGQDVVNAIAQEDVINKVVIIRKGADAKAFDAAKVFANYWAGKAEDDKKMAEIKALAKKQQEEMAAKEKQEYQTKYGGVMADKVAALAAIRKTAQKTPSGLEYKIVKTGNGKKPAAGSTIYVHYAGYLEDGNLFDTSFGEVAKTYGKYDDKIKQGGKFEPFPFVAGKKDGLIPGFLEALEQMNIGDRIVAFIPANLGYGARGAGNVIPPNSNIVFEIELLDAMPAQ